MRITSVLLAFILLIALVASVQEIPIQHRRRTPRESKILIDYVNRGPIAQRVNQLLSKIFPSALTPNIYAYPEVKIINYLDAQYYGYIFYHLVRSILVLLLKHLLLFSIQDHQIFGFLPKNADSQLLVIYTNTSTLPRALPTLLTELTLTSLMDQVLFLDTLDRTPLGLLDFKLRTHFLLKLLLFTELVLLLPSLMVFWVWHGQLFLLTDFPWFLIFWLVKVKSKATRSHFTWPRRLARWISSCFGRS